MLLRKLESTLLQDLQTGLGVTLPLYTDSLTLPADMSPSNLYGSLADQLLARLVDLGHPQEVIGTIRFCDRPQEENIVFRDALTRVFKATNYRIALLIDELAPVLRRPWGRGFCDNLRQLLSNEPGVSERFDVVITGARELYEIAIDLGSPLANVLTWRELGLFGYSESIELITKPTDWQYDKQLSMAIYREAGGHPFLMQYLLRRIYSSPSVALVAMAVKKFSRDQGHQFDMWWERLTYEERSLYAEVIRLGGSITVREAGGLIGSEKAGRALRVLCHTGILRPTRTMEKYVIAGQMFLGWFTGQTATGVSVGRDRSVLTSGVQPKGPTRGQHNEGRTCGVVVQDSVRVLHLTDLHFVDGQNVKTLVEPLLVDLDKLAVARIDFLVLSGDIADKCSPTGFSVGLEFVRRLLAAGIASSDRLIITPGNHDQLRENKSFRHVKREPRRGWFKATDLGFVVRSPQYMSRFRLFHKFYQELTGSAYPGEADSQAIVRTFEPQGVQFLGFNSAWETDKLQPSVGSLNEAAISDALRKVDSKLLPIAVWHHAPSEWIDESRTQLAYRLDEQSIVSLANVGVRIVLHGHIHERLSTVVNPYYDVRHQLHIIGGGTFSASAKDRRAGVQRMYNLIEIDQARLSFSIMSRSRGDGASPFVPHAVWPVEGSENQRTDTLTIRIR